MEAVVAPVLHICISTNAHKKKKVETWQKNRIYLQIPMYW